MYRVSVQPYCLPVGRKSMMGMSASYKLRTDWE